MSFITRFFNSLNLSKKLISAFLLVAMVPLVVLIAIAINTASNAMSQQIYSQLGSISEVKKVRCNATFKALKTTSRH